MPFTRAVFQRAAQLEIVADELPVIRAETLADSKLGSAVKPFPPEKGERDLTAEIKSVRELYENKKTLPGRLTDREEAVSDLGLRTITHAAFVALSAVRAAGTPLSKFFGVVRPPLSAIAATVAQSPRQRAIAGLGFWAAAVYLTSRLVTANATVEPRSSEVWEWATLTALVAAVGILGFAAVPILRAWRGVNPLRNYLTTLGLLGTAYGFAAALAAIYGSFNLERIVLPPEATLPPPLVVLAPLAALGVVSFSRLPIPGWLSKFTKRVEAIRGSRAFGLLMAATFILIGVWSGIDLWHEGFDGGASWQWISAAFAIGVSPLVAAASLSRWKRRPR
jgi:hypothetical protein